MSSKSTLNAKNLESLGAERLAQLLIEISTGNAEAKRRLRLELAGNESPKKLGHEIRKRIKTLSRSTAFVEWSGLMALKADLTTQSKLIVEQVAKADPQEAIELMWEFLGLADSVFGRTDYGSGSIIEIFHHACDELGHMALTAKSDPKCLAERCVPALLDNGYGQYDNLLEALKPALREPGLLHLKSHFTDMANEPRPKPTKEPHRIIAFGSAGPMYEDNYKERARRDTIRHVLKDLADALDDVDAYIALNSDYSGIPAIAANIAERLLKAGRAQEALVALNKASSNHDFPLEWEMARIDTLEALGKPEEAQDFRKTCFESTLNPDHLRAYLKRLPDFDDIEAEEQAIGYAQNFESVLVALEFLIEWPAFEAASQLISRRQTEFDGNHYGLLTVAAERLSVKFPLAATIILRKMIDFALDKARVKRYPHAARHLSECADLARHIDDFGPIDTHVTYVTKLKSVHGRKSGFWSQ